MTYKRLLWYYAGLLACVLLLAAAMLGEDCRASIMDNAHVLAGHEVEISAAISQVSSHGGDAKVVTDDPALTPEQYVDQIRRDCPTWQNASGGVKNNLIVLLVFPRQRKVGYFLGSEFTHAINSSLVRSQYMTPAFRDADYARGMVQGLKQTATLIEAFQTQALHPATTVVTQQATDLHGFWVFLDWLLVIGLVAVGVFVVLYLLRRKQERLAAQQRAVRARNEAAELVNQSPDGIHAETFAKLSNSETYNPETNGLSEEEYAEMERRYKDVADRIRGAKFKSRPESKEPEITDRRSANGTQVNQTASPTYNSVTTVYNSGPDFIPVPVVIEEPEPVRETYRETYHQSHYESSRDDSGFGGGSDDIGSSDSGFGGGSDDSSSGGDSGFSGGSDGY